MDIFISGIPPPATDTDLKNFLQPLLEQYSITTFEHVKTKNKGCGFLYIPSKTQAEVFLRSMSSKRVRFPGMYRVPVSFRMNRNQDGGDKIRILQAETQLGKLNLSISPVVQTQDPKHILALSNALPGASISPLRADDTSTFQFATMSCGTWVYEDSIPAFVPYYSNSRFGKLVLGRNALALLLLDYYGQQQWVHRIDFHYDDLDCIVLSKRDGNGVVTISSLHAPKIYESHQISPENMFWGILQRKPEVRRSRITGLDEDHRGIAGRCFVYRIPLEDKQALAQIKIFLNKCSAAPPLVPHSVPVTPPSTSFQEELLDLEKAVNLQDDETVLPYQTKFQLIKLAWNAKLSPKIVKHLIPITRMVQKKIGRFACHEALRMIYKAILAPGPCVPAHEFDLDNLSDQLLEFGKSYKQEGSIFDLLKRNPHLKLIYRLRVTPTGIYLEGPEPEVTNRVIRKYEDHIQSFVRVVFSDEDGQRIEFERNTDLHQIFHQRFKDILTNGISLCGTQFDFLGFSGSSLKSSTAWFMSPIVVDPKSRETIHASRVIEKLGDFSHIRSPAKCAARIGQAFTDTSTWFPLQPEALAWKKDVINPNTRRVFSDGCGTISEELVEHIWDKYERLEMRLKPVVFQIRYQGAKGILSLDPNLDGQMVCVRASMWKFDALEAGDIEICGMADRPLPLFLNRPLIKILEDLGVPEESFMALQNAEITKLEDAVAHTLNAADFLERERIAEAMGFPGLIRNMHKIGINGLEDVFLQTTVEATTKLHMRNLKYRGRIPVEKGVKLFGIMDETGYLKEDEIYCVIQTPKGYREVLGDPKGTGSRAKALISRSPTMHPGDVQLVYAVDVPPDSPLNALHNVVVFSQHGKRDLPSKLAGGDLDGDQYDIIFDPTLMPKEIVDPADYPRVSPEDIRRPVELRDMAHFFVEYMENDKLGLISNMHLQIADLLSGGTKENACINLAQLASTAVDYAKTGIKVDMDKAARCNSSLKPDFMAPSPRVHIEHKDFATVAFEADAEPELDAFLLLDNQRHTTYYESSKVLGKLYRRIDERGFYKPGSVKSKIMEDVFAYVVRATQGVQWSAYSGLAHDIRFSYENNLIDVMHSFAQRHTQPLLELEVISGSTFGAWNKRTRENAHDMRLRFERDVSYARNRIIMDDDGKTDEALPRSIACFAIAVQKPGRKIGKNRHLHSFRYLAAAVCLEELRKFHGGHLLPM